MLVTSPAGRVTSVTSCLPGPEKANHVTSTLYHVFMATSFPFHIMESHPPSGVMQAVVKSKVEPLIKLTTSTRTIGRKNTYKIV